MDIEANVEWNNMNFATFSRYMYIKKARLCCSFEMPYFGVDETVYTQENCVNFGCDFAKALKIYLTQQD